MALTRAKKAELIASYTDALKGAKSAVYVKFKGLSVADTSTLRGQLFSEKTHYTVVKKTLWKRATDAVGIKGEAPVTGLSQELFNGVCAKIIQKGPADQSRKWSECYKEQEHLQRFNLLITHALEIDAHGLFPIQFGIKRQL